MTAGTCIAAGCSSAVTHRYTTGPACDDHAPWALAGRPAPWTLIDPARTDRAMRIMPTPIWAKGGTDIAKERPGGYKSKQRAQREADERDAIRNRAAS